MDQDNLESKQDDARNTLSVFRNAFLVDNTHQEVDSFDSFRKRLITHELVDSSYENENERFSVDLTYTDGKHLFLDLNPKNKSFEISVPRGANGTSKESQKIKEIFLDQLKQTLEPEFAEWVVNTVLSANITHLEWTKDEENGQYIFTATLDQKKTSSLSLNGHAETDSFVQSFFNRVAPDVNLKVGRVVTGIIRPGQKTIIFSEGAEISGTQRGLSSWNPVKLLYSAAHTLADRYIPLSLKTGFNDWSSTGYKDELHMSSPSFGFVQEKNRSGQEKISIGLIDGAIQYGDKKHEMTDKWISPPVDAKSITANLAVAGL